MSSSSSISSKFLTDGETRFPCSQNLLPQEDIYSYTLKDRGGPEEYYVSSVNSQGDRVLVIQRGMRLADNLPQKIWRDRCSHWKGRTFERHYGVHSLDQWEPDRPSEERRVITRALLHRVILGFDRGEHFGDLTDPKNVYLELIKDSGVIGGDDYTCVVHIVPSPKLVRNIKVVQERELQQLRKFIFEKLLPDSKSADLLLLKEQLKDFQFVMANINFILEHPSLLCAKQRLRVFHDLVHRLDILKNCAPTTEIVTDMLQLKGSMKAAVKRLHKRIHSNKNYTWTLILRSFGLKSPIRKVMHHDPNIQYSDNKVGLLFRFIRNLGEHATHNNRGVDFPEFGDEAFLDVLIAEMFPGLLCYIVEELFTAGIYVKLPHA